MKEEACFHSADGELSLEGIPFIVLAIFDTRMSS